MPGKDDNKEKALLAKLKNHKNHLTTVRSWDEYAKLHDLPSSVSLIYQFGSWNNLKQKFHLKENRLSSYDEDTLLSIAQKHKEHFTTKRQWQHYAKVNNLPSEAVYINVFGSWNNVKDRLSMEHIPSIRRPDYEKEDIKKIVQQHGENLINRAQWDEYAKEHKLPTYKTLRKHFTWEEILSLAGSRKNSNFNKEELLEITQKHREVFFPSSINKWNEYARELSLPSSSVFLRVFGTWKKAKIEATESMNSNKNRFS